VPTYFAQIIEIESDKKMNRTLARPLASGAMSRTHAIIFGASTGIIGVSALAIFVNPVATALVRYRYLPHPFVMLITFLFLRRHQTLFSTLPYTHH
jgi:heme O synthase-like polyprenyltransferase